MTDDSCWVDLCDPDEATLRAALPAGIHDVTFERLLRPMRAGHEPRPRIEVRGSYVFGVLVFPNVDGDGVVNQEIDVIATNERLVTIRKTAPGRAVCDLTGWVNTQPGTGLDLPGEQGRGRPIEGPLIERAEIG